MVLTLFSSATLNVIFKCPSFYQLCPPFRLRRGSTVPSQSLQMAQ